jgi:acyl-CoA synthetase (AMP-forming)/AMP-acid ligase II
VPELLARRRADPDALLLVTDDERLTYREADERSLELAGSLLAQGVGKGTRVGILFPNSAQWVICWLAVTRIGGLSVPLSTFAPGGELARVLRHTDVQRLLVGRSMAGRDLTERLESGIAGLTGSAPGLALAALPHLRSIHVWPELDRSWVSRWPAADGLPVEVVREAESEVRPADELVVVSTSGSTALPKSVVHSHGSLVRHAYVLARNRGVAATDRIYSPMPFFWVGGLTMVVLQALAVGAAVIAQDVFEAGSTLRLLERERATFISCWPQASRAMADHPDFALRDLSSVRGGTLVEALPPGSRTEEPDLMPNLLGMTETGGPHTMPELPDRPLPARLRGSFGIALPGVQHRIVDATGQALPPGQDGEIQVRGLVLMDRLYKHERHEVFTEDGWYATGDRGWFDPDGHLRFTGRGTAMIKTAGSNVSPAEVEAGLRALPEVLHAFVVGLPHPVREQEVAAVVVLRQGAALSREDLLRRAREQLASYKVPTVVRIVAEDLVPMMPTGKVDYVRVLALLSPQGSASTAAGALVLPADPGAS